MNTKSFMQNVARLATAPSIENAPPIEVDAADFEEIQSFLEEENIGVSVETDLLRFRYNNVNMLVVKNDRSEDTTGQGIVQQAGNWDAVLSEEEQLIAERNTDITAKDNTPIEAASVSNEITDQRNQSEQQLSENPEQAKKELEQAAEKKAQTPPPPAPEEKKGKGK